MTSRNQYTTISMVPTELISKVFENVWVLGCEAEEVYPAELLLCQITSKWCTIAITTPQIWSRIVVTPLTSSNKIELYLKRSGAIGLTFRLDIGLESRYLEDLIYIIKPHIQRWQSLSILARSKHGLNTFLRAIAGSAPNRLEFIEMDQQYHNFSDHSQLDMQQKIFTSNALSLKILRLRSASFMCIAPSLSNITALHLHYISQISYLALCTMLDNHRCLAILEVYGEILEDRWPLPPVAILRLPSLQSLRIRSGGNNHEEFISGLLLAITAPNLKSLTLEEVVENDLGTFFQFIDQSTKKFVLLRELSLSQGHQEFSKLTWVRLFRIFSEVTDFSLHYWQVEQFYDSLRGELEPEALESDFSPVKDCGHWRCLKNLAITGGLYPGKMNHNELNALFSLLHKRLQCGLPIISLRLQDSMMEVLGDQEDTLHGLVVLWGGYQFRDLSWD